MGEPSAHVVKRLWRRAEPSPAGRPQEREALELVAGRGVVGDHAFGRRRHVTLVFEDDWAAACRDLGRDADPVERRANVLLTGGGGLDLVGRTIRVGSVRIAVDQETRPCPVMDAAAAGLQAALAPHGRGGVWGRVLVGGTISPGDTLVVEDPPRAG